MSVVATVVVLQYHHHDPNGGTMPKWVSLSSPLPPRRLPTFFLGCASRRGVSLRHTSTAALFQRFRRCGRICFDTLPPFKVSCFLFGTFQKRKKKEEEACPPMCERVSSIQVINLHSAGKMYPNKGKKGTLPGIGIKLMNKWIRRWSSTLKGWLADGRACAGSLTVN